MRPIIEDMIEQGKLLDDNGEAYESVEDAGITFAESVAEATSRLIDKIEELVNALLGIPNVERTITINEEHAGGGGGSDEEPGGHRREDIPGHAFGGYFPPRPGGKVIRVAEGSEGEYVIPESQMGAMGAITYAPVVNVNAAGLSEAAAQRAIEGALRNNMAGFKDLVLRQLERARG
jgi:hypothetical protein